MNESQNKSPANHRKSEIRRLFIDAPKEENETSNNNTEQFFNFLDRLYQAYLAKITLGVSPAAMATASYSWFTQLAQSPGRIMELASYPFLHGSDVMNRILSESQPAQGTDVRFHSDSWKNMPWRWWAESFIQVEDWWQRATLNVSGLPAHVERTVSFAVRQVLDALSPSNFVFTNPDLFMETLRSGGKNLIRGTEIGIEDFLDKLIGAPPKGAEHFLPGHTVAITPGKVVYKNCLIELIQYEAQTETVYKEPILILPAWIMKYYILDLSPHNSMVRWLVEQGHTVFMVSWKNPDGDDRNLSMDDYYRLGAMAAIDAVSALVPKAKIHLMGYCLGGTLALLTASAMGAHDDKRLKTLTLLAAQGDFTEAGELMLFITESEVAFLENMMWDQGYLDTKQMAGSFQMLRAYDLIWSKMLHDYLHGKRRGMIDLLAWNSDATRMPYKMHSEYLEKLFLNNDFAAGRYMVEGQPVVAENIRQPAFVVSTEKDHVAPWPSVYKLHFMVNSSVTFLLTSGGHNTGIISEPGHPGISYRILERKRNAPYLGPKQWFNTAPVHDGSWWKAWNTWLIRNSSEQRVLPPTLNQGLPPAPGSYVLQK